jgi:hypothetical protein
MQATAVTQATTVMSATSNTKNDSNIMTAHNYRNESHSRNVSNNRTANTVCTYSKAGMLVKTVKSAKHGGTQGGQEAAETIGTSQRQQQKGDPQEQDARNTEVETNPQQY